jgi:CheY-like chemotaxis protein
MFINTGAGGDSSSEARSVKSKRLGSSCRFSVVSVSYEKQRIPELAKDGQRALEAVEKTQYDLILMDIQMPNMNGIDAARLIREKQGEECPSIFALTAEALEGDKQRFLGLGFDGYLSKPLQTQRLKETLLTISAVGRVS